VGATSSWIDPDAADPAAAALGAGALAQELEWASFLGLQAVLVTPPPLLSAAVNFPRVISKALDGLSHMAVWVKLPLDGGGGGHKQAVAAAKQQQPSGEVQDGGGNGPGGGGADAPRDSWDDWQQVRPRSRGVGASDLWPPPHPAPPHPTPPTQSQPRPHPHPFQLFALCERNVLLGAALEVGPDLPPAPLVRRWLGQPLKALLLPTDVFTTNKRGYPVLSRPHQELLALAFRHGVQVGGNGAGRSGGWGLGGSWRLAAGRGRLRPQGGAGGCFDRCARPSRAPSPVPGRPHRRVPRARRARARAAAAAAARARRRHCRARRLSRWLGHRRGLPHHQPRRVPPPPPLLGVSVLPVQAAGGPQRARGAGGGVPGLPAGRGGGAGGGGAGGGGPGEGVDVWE
jgi:hypothetical protein